MTGSENIPHMWYSTVQWIFLMFMPNLIHQKDVSGWMCCVESICFGNSCKLYMLIPLTYQNILINSLSAQSACWYACCRLVTMQGTWENCKGWVDTPVGRDAPHPSHWQSSLQTSKGDPGPQCPGDTWTTPNDNLGFENRSHPVACTLCLLRDSNLLCV